MLRQIKLTRVGFRAHVEIASRIVSYRISSHRARGTRGVEPWIYLCRSATAWRRVPCWSIIDVLVSLRLSRKQGSCLEQEIMQGTMPGARRRGRPRTAWMDNIKTWTGLSVEESIRMTEDRDKWRQYVHGVHGQPSHRGRLKNRREVSLQPITSRR